VREQLRRPLLFLITIGAGSLIIVFDATVEVIVAGTVLAGFLALIVTGALDLVELKPSRFAAALRERKEKKRESGETDANVPADRPSLIRRLASTEINLSGMLGTLGASIRETIAHARTPKGEKKNRIEQLDLMLDEAVDGTAPDQPLTPVTPKAGGGGAVDPLASLADLDLDSLADLDINGEGSGPGAAFDPDHLALLSGEDEDAVSAILRTHQSGLDDLDLTSGLELTGEPAVTPLPMTAAGIPELPGGDGIPDMSVLSAELSALDDLDPGEIEIEGEEVAADEPLPEEEDVLEEEPEEEFDMVSFASGGTVDDDLIASLKSDAKKRKFVEDVSLVRELKGEKYAAADLAAELEDLLAAMNAER